MNRNDLENALVRVELDEVGEERERRRRKGKEELEKVVQVHRIRWDGIVVWK